PRRIYDDQAVLQEVGEADASLWMEGKDPFEERKSYQIAKDYAQKNPGHSEKSTVFRINRKLKKQRRAGMYFSLAAHLLSMTHKQICRYFDEVAEHLPIYSKLLSPIDQNFDQIIKNYHECFGRPPAATSCFIDLVEEMRAARASQPRR